MIKAHVSYLDVRNQVANCCLKIRDFKIENTVHVMIQIRCKTAKKLQIRFKSKKQSTNNLFESLIARSNVLFSPPGLEILRVTCS